MSIFTILTYTMLALVVVTGVASIPRSLGGFWDRHGIKRRGSTAPARLRSRA